MLAKRLHIQLMSWMPNDYSEKRDHDHELEWYLWFEGRQGFSLFDTGPSDLVPAYGHFKDTRSNVDTFQPMIYPLVVKNRFKVRLVAIERDGPQWLDPDDTAKGEFYIDLDTKYPPVSDWRIIAADPRNTDLNVEASFRLQWLEYVETDEIQDNGPPSIQNRLNYPYPWSGVTVFEHWLGLGQHKTLDLGQQNLASRREFLSFTSSPGQPGQIRRMVQSTYRFGVNQLGVPNDTISSVFVPKQTSGSISVTLYEHDFGDSRFAQGAKKAFRTWGLHNLSDYGFDDRVSSVEIVQTYPKHTGPDVH